jgi:hypothetical protein
MGEDNPYPQSRDIVLAGSPKIDHFIGFISDSTFVQEVAYGTRKLKLSSCEKIEIPNVVRNIITSRILKQYTACCKETDLECLSTRELYRILKFCPAKQKQALQGHDNTSSDGLRSIERLEDIAMKLVERRRSLEWVRNVIDAWSYKHQTIFEIDIPTSHFQRIRMCRSLRCLCTE